MHRQGLALLSSTEIEVVDTYLTQVLEAVQDLNLQDTTELPAWGEKPLHLVKVASHLQSIVAKTAAVNQV